MKKFYFLAATPKRYKQESTYTHNFGLVPIYDDKNQLTHYLFVPCANKGNGIDGKLLDGKFLYMGGFLQEGYTELYDSDPGKQGYWKLHKICKI